jgi:hypothetical protein
LKFLTIYTKNIWVNFSGRSISANIIADDNDNEIVGGKKASIQWSFEKSKASSGAYNDLYPLSKPISTEKGLRFRIGIISDLDVESKTTGGKWMSYLRRGDLFLHYDAQDPKLSKVKLY